MVGLSLHATIPLFPGTTRTLSTTTATVHFSIRDITPPTPCWCPGRLLDNIVNVGERAPLNYTTLNLNSDEGIQYPHAATKLKGELYQSLAATRGNKIPSHTNQHFWGMTTPFFLPAQTCHTYRSPGVMSGNNSKSPKYYHSSDQTSLHHTISFISLYFPL